VRDVVWAEREQRVPADERAVVRPGQRLFVVVVPGGALLRCGGGELQQLCGLDGRVQQLHVEPGPHVQRNAMHARCGAALCCKWRLLERAVRRRVVLRRVRRELHAVHSWQRRVQRLRLELHAFWWGAAVPAERRPGVQRGC